MSLRCVVDGRRALGDLGRVRRRGLEESTPLGRVLASGALARLARGALTFDDRHGRELGQELRLPLGENHRVSVGLLREREELSLATSHLFLGFRQRRLGAFLLIELGLDGVDGFSKAREIDARKAQFLGALLEELDETTNGFGHGGGKKERLDHGYCALVQ